MSVTMFFCLSFPEYRECCGGRGFFIIIDKEIREMSEVMSMDELKEDVAYWQRLMRFAGYECGAIDGVRGVKTRGAEELWAGDAKRYALEYGVFDERTERNLATVMPAVQKMLRVWLRKVQRAAAAMEYEVKVIEGTRSYGRQNELYAQGRTAKGTKVTNARGGASWHNFGLAVDFGVFRGKSYVTDDEVYKVFGQLARTVNGLEWGGSWKSFKDYPHVQAARYGSVSGARAAFEGLK